MCTTELLSQISVVVPSRVSVNGLSFPFQQECSVPASGTSGNQQPGAPQLCFGGKVFSFSFLS